MVSRYHAEKRDPSVHLPPRPMPTPEKLPRAARGPRVIDNARLLVERSGCGIDPVRRRSFRNCWGTTPVPSESSVRHLDGTNPSSRPCPVAIAQLPNVLCEGELRIAADCSLEQLSVPRGECVRDGASIHQAASIDTMKTSRRYLTGVIEEHEWIALTQWVRGAAAVDIDGSY